MVSVLAIAQSSSLLMGARAAGMGYTSACLYDEWAVFNNPGGLSEIKNSTASFSYNAYPSIKSFNRMAAVFAAPIKIGVVGVGVYRFGDDLYNEQVLTGAFSNKFGLASLGLEVNYIQYQAQGFGRKGVVTFNFGGIAQLTPQLFIGAHITNINQPKISKSNENETVPARLTAGLGFKPSEKILVCSEIEKDLSHDMVWRMGMEYQFSKKFQIRTGINLHPNAGFFGVGFKPGNFALHYALDYNFNIGMNHQATVSYKFSGR